MPANQKYTVIIAYSTQCKKTHIATNMIRKEGYIIDFNLLNGANMTLWVKDLQYSAYTNMATYDTISQWLDIILYHKLCYQYGLFMPLTLIKMYQNII